MWWPRHDPEQGVTQLKTCKSGSSNKKKGNNAWIKKGHNSLKEKIKEEVYVLKNDDDSLDRKKNLI